MIHPAAVLIASKMYENKAQTVGGKQWRIPANESPAFLIKTGGFLLFLRENARLRGAQRGVGFIMARSGSRKTLCVFRRKLIKMSSAEHTSAQKGSELRMPFKPLSVGSARVNATWQRLVFNRRPASQLLLEGWNSRAQFKMFTHAYKHTCLAPAVLSVLRFSDRTTSRTPHPYRRLFKILH